MSKSVSSYKLQNELSNGSKQNSKGNCIPRKCSHSHTQLDSDCESVKQNLTQRPIKHAFLKKNSRESLASSLSKKPKQNTQQNNKVKNIAYQTTNKLNTKMASLNKNIKTNKDQSNFLSGKQIQTQNKLNTKKSYQTQKQKYFDSEYQESNYLYKAIEKNGLLCPPSSSLNSKRESKLQSQKSSEAKICSFSNYIRQNPSTLRHSFKQSNSIRSNYNQDLQTNQQNTTKISQKHTNISYLTKQQIQICPQLFYLYRSQYLQQQIDLGIMSIRMYSKRRKQIRYSNGIVQVYYNNGSDIKLTRWPNGDFKLKDQNKISCWNDELGELDQYFLD